jgi:hypothetical protein
MAPFSAASVLALLADGTPRSTGELAACLGTDAAALRECVTRLAKSRRIVRVGTRKEAAPVGSWFPSRAVSHAVWALPGGAVV